MLPIDFCLVAVRPVVNLALSIFWLIFLAIMFPMLLYYLNIKIEYSAVNRIRYSAARNL